MYELLLLFLDCLMKCNAFTQPFLDDTISIDFSELLSMNNKRSSNRSKKFPPPPLDLPTPNSSTTTNEETKSTISCSSSSSSSSKKECSHEQTSYVSERMILFDYE